MGLYTNMHTEAHQGGSGEERRWHQSSEGTGCGARALVTVAGCLFEDPGTHSRASSAHGIEGQWGRARFREFLPLTLPLELSISPSGACDIVLSPAKAMCGDNHSPLLPQKVWGRQGLPSTDRPSFGGPFSLPFTALSSQLPSASRVPHCHPGLSPILPTHFTLVSFKECLPGGYLALSEGSALPESRSGD